MIWITRAALLASLLTVAAGPMAAASQKLVLDEVSVVVPSGCKPVQERTPDGAAVSCAWGAAGGDVETVRLFRAPDRDDPSLSNMADLSKADQALMRGAMFPAYLSMMMAFSEAATKLPPGVGLPAGFAPTRVIAEKAVDPGPNGMDGFCLSLGVSGKSRRQELKSLTLYCAAVGREPGVLLNAGVTISVAQAKGATPPSDFMQRSWEIAKTLRVGR